MVDDHRADLLAFLAEEAASLEARAAFEGGANAPALRRAAEEYDALRIRLEHRFHLETPLAA